MPKQLHLPCYSLSSWIEKKTIKVTFMTYICDEHNEAFYYWHEAKYQGILDQPFDLLHVDAHDDMGQPQVLEKSLYYADNQAESYLEHYKKLAQSHLDTGGFIRPAVLTGVVRNVYFVYPDWRNYRQKRQRLTICSVFGEGRNLRHNLKIDETTDPKVLRAFPDLKWFAYSTRSKDNLPRKRKVILDIDFDYFACIDTIRNHLWYDLEVTPDQFDRQAGFLTNKSLAFAALDFKFFERDGKYYVKVSHQKLSEESYLPSKHEIESEIDGLISRLVAGRVKPVVITLCRSCISGYCPASYRSFIEEKLTHRLKAAFG
jgi:hypothetical protein